MHFAHLGAQRGGRHAIAHFPAGHVEGFAERGHRDRALAQLRVGQHAGVPAFGEADVFVNLVAEHVDFAFGDSVPQLLHVFRLPGGGGRVVRRVDDHQAGARRQRGGEPWPIHGKRGRLQGDAFEYAAGQRDRRRIAVVAGIEADHFVAGAHQRADGGEQRSVAPAVTVTSAVASGCQPYSSAVLSAMASRSGVTPVIGAYWLAPWATCQARRSFR